MIWRVGALLAIALVGLHLATAGWGHLFNETDGQYAGAAKVMAEGGSWLIPENNGIPRLVKPPLLYWGMATCMGIFGIGDFAARLPGALSLVLWVVITVLIGREWGGARRGWIAGTILATMLGSFTLARIVMPEPLFSMLIAASLLCVVKAIRSPFPKRWMIAFWTLAGLAAFAKGPHGLIYPVAILVVAALFHHLANRNSPSTSASPHRLPMFPIAGLLLAVLINLPWFVFIERQFPGYITNLIFSEHLGHVTGSSSPATNYSNVPRLTFLVLHLAWFFPWSVAVLTALPKTWRSFLHPKTWTMTTWLLISWAAVVLGTVMLAGQRQDYYAMSLWPAFALIASRILEKSNLRLAAGLVAALLGAALVACLAAPSVLADMQTATVEERATALTTVLQFGPEVWSGLTTIAAISLGSAIGFSLLILWKPKHGFWIMAAAASCLGLGAIAGTAKVAPFFSLADIGPQLETATGESGILVFDGDIDTASSLLFYTNREITLLGANADADFVVRTQGTGRHTFLKEKDLETLWSSEKRVVFVTESSKLASWQTKWGPISPIAKCGTLIAISNRP